MSKPKIGYCYAHFKEGTIYIVYDLVKREEDGQESVSYKDASTDERYNRTLASWEESGPEGQERYREIGPDYSDRDE